MLSCTRFTALKPARLSKRFTLAGDTLVKESGGQLFDGIAERLTVASLPEFADLLATLKPNQALAYGINGHDRARVVPVRDLERTPGAIARTRDHFAWPAGAGLLMLDYDPAPDGTPLDCAALRAALTAACPALANAPMVWRPSASSCIHTVAGAELRGIAGQRLYVAVLDAGDITRAGAVLIDRLWLAGFGRYDLSKSGALLPRTVIDASVFQPERLDFCGGADCGAGLIQRLPAPVLFNHDAPCLDTRRALPDLASDEQARLEGLRAALAAPLAGEQARIREAWIVERVSERAASLPEPERAKVRPQLERVYRQAAEGGRLGLDFDLVVVAPDSQTRERRTVRELLNQRDRYHEATTLDPLEPDYPDGQARLVGWLNLRAREPYLTSQAHGGTRYRLGAEPQPIDEETAWRCGVGEREPGCDDDRGEVPAGAPLDLDAYRGTDDANAVLFLQSHGADVRFCPPWDKWLLWTGSHWRIDDRLDIHRLAADIPRLLYRRAGEAADSSERRKIATLAGKLERTALRATMLIAVRHHVVVHHSDLDKGRFLLNCRNGTVDLRTGTLRPHDRADLLTHDTEIPYSPTAACPTWTRFLLDVFAGDADLIQFVQRAVGYSLTGDVREQVLLIPYGVGSNGKSVFLNILRRLLGKLAWQAAPDLLLADKQRRHPTEQADLFGKRVIVCQETGEGRRFNETLVKQLTGGDAITARRMHEDNWSFDPTHKLWLSTNHRPEIRGTDYAIWRRIRLIPFSVQFTDDSSPRKDPTMEERLTAELPGILAWAVAGCLDWQKHGLGTASAVKAATASYQAEMDVLAAWLGDCCVMHRNAKARASALYRTYAEWCERGGEHAENQRKFGQRLAERGLQRYSNDGVWYRGIGLRAEGTEGTESISPIFTPPTSSAQNFSQKSSDSSVHSVNPVDDGLSSHHPVDLTPADDGMNWGEV